MLSSRDECAVANGGKTAFATRLLAFLVVVTSYQPVGTVEMESVANLPDYQKQELLKHFEEQQVKDSLK